jgi:ubiquinone/menaquinone biosynthesis C-methylase UbiE
MTLPAYAANQSSFPEMYERWIVGPLFQPWAELLLDRVQISPGDRLLDVACGTGIVARQARQRLAGTGRVVGVDASPPMLDVAKGIAPEIEWRHGNASAIPLEPGETFDVVTCQQGMQFFPEKAAAAREMRRALAPSGRVGVAIWLGLDDNPFFAELHAVAERHLGPIVDARHGYGDGEALAALLRDAGFRDVTVDREVQAIRFADTPTFIRLNSMAVVGMSAAGKSMTDEQKGQAAAQLAEASSGVAERYADRGELVFDIASNIATARG